MAVSTSTRKRRSFGRDIRAAVWQMTEGRCFYCGRRTNPFATFTIDHIYPVSKGGSDDIENLVPCCARCNGRKGSMTLDDWVPDFDLWCHSEVYMDEYAYIRAYVIEDWNEAE